MLRELAGLHRRVSGPVRLVRPGSGVELPAYSSTTHHQPWLVVEPSGAADMQYVVRAAARIGARVEVVGSGHGSRAAAPGSIVLSTGALRAVTIDEDRRVARIQAGARWSDVIHEANAAGLAPISGSAPSVGVSGYLLGGGYGLLSREFGFGSDHLRSAILVDAEGTRRPVDPSEDPDLWWALRGSGHAFGVIESVEIDLVPLPAFTGGGLFFPASAAPRLLPEWRDWARSLPDLASTSWALVRYPLTPMSPQELAGRAVVHVRFAFAGDTDEAARLLRQLRNFSPLLADTVRRRPFTESGQVHLDPPGPFALVDDAVLLDDLTADTIDTFIRHAGPDSSGTLRLAEIRHLGGRMAEQVPGSSISHRGAGYLVYASAAREQVAPGAVPQPGRDVDRLFRALAPESTGRPLTFLGPATRTRLLSAYEPTILTRLRRLQALHDPADLFASARVLGPIEARTVHRPDPHALPTSPGDVP